MEKNNQEQTQQAEQKTQQGQNNQRKRAQNPFRNRNKNNNQNLNSQKSDSKEQTNSKNNQYNNKNNKRYNNNNKRTNAQRNSQRTNKTRLRIDSSVPAELKQSILDNERVQKERMEPWKKINLAGGKVRFTPLGGLGEIGGNIAVLETETTAIIIDVGMSFPDETMHGVDILVPDFSYLHAIKDKIKAIVITHGHEDHIGAMPYLFCLKSLSFLFMQHLLHLQ